MSYSRAAADDLALQALIHVVSQPELASALMTASGLAPDAFRQAAQDPEFRIYLLDFILEDDRRVQDFSADAGIRPEEVLAARTALAGPGSFGWDPD